MKKEKFLGEDERILIYNKSLSADIELNYSGIKETLGPDTFKKMPKNIKEKKIATIRMLPDIIKKAVVKEDNASNYHNTNSGINYAYLEVSVVIDGKPNRVKIDIKKSRQKNKFWVHSIYEIEENQTLLGSSGLMPKLALKEMSDFREDNITRTDESQENNSEIKKSLKSLDTEYLNATESGDAETAQRLVDEAANVVLLSKRFDSNKSDIRFSYKAENNSLEQKSKISYSKYADLSPLSFNHRAQPNPNSNINWVLKSQIFSVVENKLFHQKISEINQGSKAFEKNQSEEYMLTIENKIVFTDVDYDLPEITKIIEVVDEYATNFETIKELIYGVERGKTGHRDAVQTIENSFGKGYILQYESGSNVAYEWETGRRKGKNRREAVRNCLKQQQRGRNAPQVKGTDAEIKKSLKAEDDAPSAIDRYYAEAIRENRAFSQIFALMGDIYSSKMGEVYLDNTDIRKTAKGILKEFGSKYDEKALADELQIVYDTWQTTEETSSSKLSESHFAFESENTENNVFCRDSAQHKIFSAFLKLTLDIFIFYVIIAFVELLNAIQN